MGATFVCFWPCLDHPVCPDGHLRLAGLALRRYARESRRAFTVLAAALVQRALELAFLCVAFGGMGVCRDCGALVSDCCHPRVFLARATFGWRPTHSVLVVGQLRVGA